MSYSRWINSYWYTYWYYNEEENYDTASFCICDFKYTLIFTAKKLRERFEHCLDIVKIKDKLATKDEIEELAGYMYKFLKDVDQEYLNK